jgi:hypothetical protein
MKLDGFNREFLRTPDVLCLHVWMDVVGAVADVAVQFIDDLGC